MSGTADDPLELLSDDNDDARQPAKRQRVDPACVIDVDLEEELQNRDVAAVAAQASPSMAQNDSNVDVIDVDLEEETETCGACSRRVAISRLALHRRFCELQQAHPELLAQRLALTRRKHAEDPGRAVAERIRRKHAEDPGRAVAERIRRSSNVNSKKQRDPGKSVPNRASRRTHAKRSKKRPRQNSAPPSLSRGSRLLEKMGWQAGTGIGKNPGMLEPLTAVSNNGTCGLGFQGKRRK